MSIDIITLNQAKSYTNKAIEDIVIGEFDLTSYEKTADANTKLATKALKNGNTVEDFSANDITVSGNILPTVNGTQNLGSTTNRFGTIFVNEAKLSTNTLYLGDTPVMGTSGETIIIKGDPNQHMVVKTSGVGTTKVISENGVELSTSGMNANINVQATGSGANANLTATNEINLIAPNVNIKGVIDVTGDTTVDNLTIGGNLVVNGSSFVTEAITVRVADNIIELNKNEVGHGVTAGKAGLKINRGDADPYLMIFDETDDMFKVGTDSSLQIIASQDWVNSKVSNVNNTSDVNKPISSATQTVLDGKANTIHTHEITSINGLSDKFLNYYTKLETLSTSEINTLVNNISKGMSWKESVVDVASLPLTNNSDTDTRITKDNLHINIWSTNLSTWIDLGGSATIPMSSLTLDGQMSKENYAKLSSIVLSNLATVQQLADGLATKSDTSHIHNNYVEKITGASLPLDSKQAIWDAKANISDIPTTTSSLTNNSGFITSSAVDTKLTDYQTNVDITTKLQDYAKTTEVSNAVSNAHTHTYKSVLDKFTEVGGKPYYDGSAIGGEIGISTWNTFNL